MPRFAANLSLLFTELPFLQRFAAAARCGFRAVEFQFPYTIPPLLIAEQLERCGLELVLHNLPAGDWDGGERGIACNPDRISEFREGVGRGIEYATLLGCPQLNCLAGIPPADAEPEQVTQTLIDNLRYAARELQRANLGLLIEPINSRDIPGFYLQRSSQALELIQQVNAPNLKLQYDLYHMQIMEGDLAPTLQNALEHIGHIQLADTPGRHEPGTGEINFPFLFDWLDALGYDGWIGCEYRPLTTTEAGLSWLHSYWAGNA